MKEEKLDEIRREIIDILCNKLNCVRKDKAVNMDAPLTGGQFMLSDVGMLYLLFEVEKRYGIRFREEDLLDYGFSTANRIAELVLAHQAGK